MRIIEKIEIKNFRCFLGTTKDDRAEIANVTDLNIFSWSNDSWKSNILRALNLFFNEKIDTVHDYDFESDFNLHKKEMTHKVIEIKIHFSIWGRNFSISQFWDRYWYRNFEYSFVEDGFWEVVIDSRADINKKRYSDNSSLLDRENGYRRYASRFISSISYSYVPAIREERFFSHLYGKIISQIKENEDEQVKALRIEKGKIDRWEKTSKNKTEKKDFLEKIQIEEWRSNRLIEIAERIETVSAFEKSINGLEAKINEFSAQLFNSVSFLSSEFRIGSNLKDFFESFEIWTWQEKNLSLRLRWDWLQAKFIPEMLNFLDSISSKRYFIWWFEEPENSAEYRNQQDLAHKLKNDFSHNRQIFLTTHSEEFLSLYDWAELDKEKRRANLYHVKKINNHTYDDFSIIRPFDVEKQTFDFMSTKTDIEDDLWTSIIRAKYSKEIQSREIVFLKEKGGIEAQFWALKEQVSAMQKPILLVEDDYYQIYKIAWLKRKGIVFSLESLDRVFNENSPFSIGSKGGRSNVKWLLNTTGVYEFSGKKIIGLFDFDEAWEDFSQLDASGFWWGIEGVEKEGLWRKRSDHNCFHAMVLPVPESRKNIAWRVYKASSKLWVERLFEESVLESILPGAAKDYLIWGVELVKINNKSSFFKKTYPLEASAFVNFDNLFKRIHTLFELSPFDPCNPPSTESPTS